MKKVNYKWMLIVLLSVFVLSCKKDAETSVSSGSGSSSGGGGSTSKTTAPVGTSVGNAAYGFTGTDVMTGKSFALSSTLGKYTIIDVWGINCGNCAYVAPKLLALLANAKYAGKLTLVGLACNSGVLPTTSSMQAEATRLQMNSYPQLNDGSGAIYSKLYSSGSFTLPLEVLVDPYGVIVFQGTGANAGNDIEAYLQSNFK